MLRGHSYKNIIAFLIDLSAGLAAVMLGIYLRLGDRVFAYPMTFFIDQLILFTISIIVAQTIFKIYRGVWRFFNLEYLIKIAKFAILAVMVFLLIQFFDSRLDKFPRSVVIIDWLLMVLFISAPRILYRAYFDGSFKFTLQSNLIDPSLLLIVGLDKSIEKFVQEMASMHEPIYKIVGIVDKKAHNVGRTLLNVPVLGTIEDLKSVINYLASKQKRPSRILVSSDFTLAGELQDLISVCEELAIPISRLPKLGALSHHVTTALPLNPIPIEDLLHRLQKNLNIRQIKALTQDEVVLVTGAGGSIGSEIVRQVAASKPKKLLLLDASEFLLYEVEQECKMKFPKIELRTILVDIRDQKSLTKVFAKFKPRIVFHAAALKHVPLMEQHKVSAVETNIFGTINLVDLAIEYKCKKFVMISTDKAVDPLSFMGASKRIAEMYCQLINPKSMQISVVRFGNVLGSNGSVVPLFEKQIADGGPVTVTSAEATRFFMTIKEAVGLVLQAAVLKPKEVSNCNMYVLDMGQPVKIVDLARKMIILAGLKPDIDIKIKFIGLRPGEKMHEILVTEHEALTKTINSDIFLAHPRASSMEQLLKLITQLKTACANRNEKKCRESVNAFFAGNNTK